jgi:hypothetical protein
MLRSLRKILSEMLGIAKKVEEIKDNQEQDVRMFPLQIQNVLYPQGTSSTHNSSSEISSTPYCLWCWVIVCIFCGFIAFLFIASVFLSLIISLTDRVMEHQCQKIEGEL